MTVAPSHPYVHSYDPGKDPMEVVKTPSGSMERWRADALLLGETSAAIQARHDAVSTLKDLEEQKRELAASQAALAIERATFDAEKRSFADQAATLAGRLSSEWDRMEKLRADQLEEPLAVPPGSGTAPGYVSEANDASDPSDPSKHPEPLLELEGDAIAGTDPGDPSEEDPYEDPYDDEDEVEFPNPELPKPPVQQQPVAAGLDADKDRS